MAEWRVERDALGEVKVPRDAHFGPETQRAVENFRISGRRVDPRIVHALGLIKRSAARVNCDLGLLPAQLEKAIAQASTEVATGRLDDQFVVDAYQTGSYTSTHVNANEVVASRANEILGGARGARTPVHPHDHVNLGQSSNDVMPSAVHVAAATSIQDALVPALRVLAAALEDRSHRFDRVVKLGRTHLQDAVPVRLGQEFGGWHHQVRAAIRRAEEARDQLLEVPLGGSAVGTGLNTHPDFGRKAIARLAEDTGLPFRAAGNSFEAQAARDAMVDASGRLVTIGTSLAKIATDLRLLASGPRGGIGELRLPALQPGSSMMPGKVNPVVPEVVAMVAARVAGNHVTVTMAGQGGQLELTATMPAMGEALLESITLLSGAARTLGERCVKGVEADEERCAELLERSLALATALVPLVGHEAAADLAREAEASGRTIREVAAASQAVPARRLAEALEPMRQTEPGRSER